MPSTDQIRSNVQAIVHVQVDPAVIPDEVAEEKLRAKIEATLSSDRPYPVLMTPTGVTITLVHLPPAEEDPFDFPGEDDEHDGCDCSDANAGGPLRL